MFYTGHINVTWYQSHSLNWTSVVRSNHSIELTLKTLAKSGPFDLWIWLCLGLAWVPCPFSDSWRLRSTLSTLWTYWSISLPLTWLGRIPFKCTQTSCHCWSFYGPQRPDILYDSDTSVLFIILLRIQMS